MELDDDFIRYLKFAGWHPNWTFDVPVGISADHPAYAVLSQFGGIHIQPANDSGIECGTADVEFRPLDHRWATVDKWRTLLSTELVGIALASETYEQLWLASDGRVFSSNDVTDDFGFVGNCVQSAARNLLTGIRQRPLLLPGQSSVTYYGERYSRDDPRVYEWQPSVE